MLPPEGRPEGKCKVLKAVSLSLSLSLFSLSLSLSSWASILHATGDAARSTIRPTSGAGGRFADYYAIERHPSHGLTVGAFFGDASS